MENKPLVSIVIPVYNGSNYVREAIDSALAQTYENIEILVINDGSTDDGKTDEVVRSYGDKVRYFNKENGGVSSALNVGIKNMQGEYFSWLSHDDVYTPDKVEKQVERLSEVPDNNTLILCSARQIDKDSNPLPRCFGVKEAGNYTWQEAVNYITANGASGCAFLIPKKAFDDAGLFDEKLRFCQDQLMWWNIFLCHYSLCITPDIGVLSRVHGAQVTHTRSDLYVHDANFIGGFMPEKMMQMEKGNNSYLLNYAIEEAIHGNSEVVKRCISVAAKNKRFSASQRIKITGYSAYGKLRPAIRKTYYKIFRKV